MNVGHVWKILFCPAREVWWLGGPGAPALARVAPTTSNRQRRFVADARKRPGGEPRPALSPHVPNEAQVVALTDLWNRNSKLGTPRPKSGAGLKTRARDTCGHCGRQSDIRSPCRQKEAERKTSGAIHRSDGRNTRPRSGARFGCIPRSPSTDDVHLGDVAFVERGGEVRCLSLLAKQFGLGVVLVVAFATSGYANNIGTCEDGASLEDYIGLGSTGCVIGDKVFSDFTYATLFANDATPVAAADVIVHTIAGPDIGLTFEGEWYSTFTGVLSQTLSYTVGTVSGRPLIKDNTLTFYAYTGITSDPFASVIESKCLGAAFSPYPTCGGTIASLIVFDSPLISQDTAHLDFSPVSIVGVRNVIFVSGGTGTAEIESFTNTFSQVPEPGLLLLLGAGASGSLVHRLRKHRI